jgi:glycosyltransferase involved in cell wall biosynthesis
LWRSTQDEYALPECYVVAFGGGSAHKNISRLIAALGLACRDLPHHLVLIGHLPPGMDLAKEASRADLSGRIRTLGYIPSAHIAPILGHADLFVLPSLYEGFGLPVLEAQRAGVPIACSTAGSLPEVAGKGAILFDPLSVDNMVEVIRDCLSNANLRANLRQLGKENLQRFSWENAARETLNVYEMIYETTPRR